jgi:hypothetical protein
MIRTFFAFIIFSAAVLAAQPSYSLGSDLKMYDISILYPLPENITNNLLLRPGDNAEIGSLIPIDFFNQIPNLNESEMSDVYENLRAISIRLDPCAASPNSVEKCTAQIRIVWQPLKANEDGSVSTDDVSLHTFYTISEKEMIEIFTEIETYKESLLRKMEMRFNLTTNEKVRLVGSIEDNYLSVHPILKFEGMQGVFAKKLKTLFLSKIGQGRLTKLTFMRNLGSGIWNFGGFDIKNLQLTLISIAHLHQHDQYFYNSTKTKLDFVDGGPVPAVVNGDFFTGLISDSSKTSQFTEGELIEFVKAAVRVENPLFNSASTVDCVGCHTAQMARIWAVNNRPDLNLPNFIAPLTYQSNYDLTNFSSRPEDTTNLRAFGYFEDRPAISQRVIYESAETLRLIQQQR